MKIIINGKPESLTYQEICGRLHADPLVRFVHVTSTGRVGFTCGKPNEIRWLYGAIERAGMLPSKALAATMRGL